MVIISVQTTLYYIKYTIVDDVRDGCVGDYEGGTRQVEQVCVSMLKYMVLMMCWPDWKRLARYGMM